MDAIPKEIKGAPLSHAEIGLLAEVKKERPKAKIPELAQTSPISKFIISSQAIESNAVSPGSAAGKPRKLGQDAKLQR